MYSLNEIDSTAKRAARGVGMPWGMAEEFGKATRWLEGRGLPGIELAAVHLTGIDGVDHRAMYPVVADGVWGAPSKQLCPIAAGVALSDFSETWESELSFGAMAYPMLILSHVAQVAKRRNLSLHVAWQDAALTVSPSGGVEGAPDRAAVVERVTVSMVDAEIAERAPHRPDVINMDAWRVLETLGHRTFAPNTESSRRLGAGGADD